MRGPTSGLYPVTRFRLKIFTIGWTPSVIAVALLLKRSGK
jgi:hypothetical protein